jgi:hypothetical protein
LRIFCFCRVWPNVEMFLFIMTVVRGMLFFLF